MNWSYLVFMQIMTPIGVLLMVAWILAAVGIVYLLTLSPNRKKLFKCPLLDRLGCTGLWFLLFANVLIFGYVLEVFRVIYLHN
jgi:hypothetical protein